MIKILSTNCKDLVSFWILVNQTSFLNKMQQSSRNGLVFWGKKCPYISWTNWNDVLEVFLKTVYAKSKLQLNKYFQVGIIMFWTDQWHWCGKHPLVSWKVFFSWGLKYSDTMRVGMGMFFITEGVWTAIKGSHWKLLHYLHLFHSKEYNLFKISVRQTWVECFI